MFWRVPRKFGAEAPGCIRELVRHACKTGPIASEAATCEAGVELTTTQRSGTARIQKALRELLGYGLFGKRVTDTCLTGSYARRTADRQLDAVNIVAIISPVPWQSGWFASHARPRTMLTSFAT